MTRDSVFLRFRQSLARGIALFLANVLLGMVAHAATPTQLPLGVVPVHYDVSFTPDAQALTFAATTVVTIDVQQRMDAITLHASELQFSKVDLLADVGEESLTAYGTPKIRLNSQAQTASFVFAKPLAKGRYRLRMAYTGRIGTQATGLFALDYPAAAGPKRALYTQFENSEARRFIPGWDEPAFKATFELQAVVPDSQMAVSNMPVSDTTALGNGMVRTRFATSPKMSTYLLFFALGDFERAALQLGDTGIGVITKRGSLAQAEFVLHASKDVLAQFNDYFGVPYPLPKLDNVAAPGQSQFFGAMENWGAIFTFEYAMLLDPAFSSPRDRQGAFSTAAHEIAHQWFGNLVTMQWWDDLWLNEGFASWMESRITTRLHPEWNTALKAVGGRDWAMDLDALKTTHPVVAQVKTVEQVSQAFDAITYQKGEAVIRMLEAYVGEEAWRAGVRDYMKRHAYGSSYSHDLWRAMDAQTGGAVSGIAHDFTRQPGVPLIHVGEQKCVDGRAITTLTQSEFSKDQPNKKPLRWQVPVIAKSIGVGAQAEVRTLIKSGRADIAVAGCAPVVVNAGQTGYYRTLYAPGNMRELVRQFGQLQSIDQLGVLSDSWALGMAGLQPASDILDLALVTPVDADPQVWGKIAQALVRLDELYRSRKVAGKDAALAAAARARFVAHAIKTLRPALERTGWTPIPDEPAAVAILRGTLIDALSSLGDEQTIAQARQRYARRVSDPDAVPGALRKTILGVVARHADAPAWDSMHAEARAEKSPMVRDRLYAMLAASEDAVLAQRALDLALSPEPGATSSAAMIERVSVLHPELAFGFAVTHMAAVNEKIDATSRPRYIPGLAETSADPAMIKKVQAFARAHIAPGSRRGAQTAVAGIANQIKMCRERLPLMDAWLAQS